MSARYKDTRGYMSRYPHSPVLHIASAFLLFPSPYTVETLAVLLLLIFLFIFIMRFLDTTTGRFRWIDNPNEVRYAILSHVWAKTSDSNYTPEQTYEDVRRIEDDIMHPDQSILPYLSPKIRAFCETSRKDGFELGWVDSCCIDKKSSSELSEALNSMYEWYTRAEVCYAFLHDVYGTLDEQELAESLAGSTWFKRGWTLQELLAPSVVLFLSSDWEFIGSKYMLASLIEKVTGIDRNVLTSQKSLDSVSVARRMSWAALRETTREEDEAYSLMGIFGVTIPTTYGEGRRAFIRLQEEILKRTADQTIFAWGPVLPDDSSQRWSLSTPSHAAQSHSQSPSQPVTNDQYLLATSPKEFEHSYTSSLRCISRKAFADRLHLQSDDASYQMYKTTPYGIRAELPIVAVLPSEDPRVILPTHLAVLACEDADGRLLTLLLRPRDENSGPEYFVGTITGFPLIGSDGFSGYMTESYYCRATFISPDRLRDFVEMSRIFIPHQPTPTVYTMERDAARHAILGGTLDAYEVRLSPWSKELLRLQGYRVSQGDDRLPGSSFSSSVASVVISGWDAHIRIRVGRCGCRFGHGYLGRGVLAVQVLSGSMADSVEKKAENPHFLKDPAHINSWTFRCGVASKEFILSGTGTDERRVLKLTFTHDPRASNRGTKMYQLGIEMYGPRSGLYRGARPSRRSSRLPVPIRASSRSTDARAGTHLVHSSSPSQMQRTRSNSHPSFFGAVPTALQDTFNLTVAGRRTASPESLHRSGRYSRDRSPSRMLLCPPITVEDSSAASDVSTLYDPATPPGSPPLAVVPDFPGDSTCECVPKTVNSTLNVVEECDRGGFWSGLLSYIWGWRTAFCYYSVGEQGTF